MGTDNRVVVSERSCAEAQGVEEGIACRAAVAASGKDARNFVAQRLSKDDFVSKVACSWFGHGCEYKVVEKDGKGR